jgi:hypothetical protein
VREVDVFSTLPLLLSAASTPVACSQKILQRCNIKVIVSRPPPLISPAHIFHKFLISKCTLCSHFPIGKFW